MMEVLVVADAYSVKSADTGFACEQCSVECGISVAFILNSTALPFETKDCYRRPTRGRTRYHL
jgi:hypothetical protein